MAVPPGLGLQRTKNRNRRRSVLKQHLKAQQSAERHTTASASPDSSSDSSSSEETLERPAAWRANVALIHVECCSDYDGSPPPPPHIPQPEKPAATPSRKRKPAWSDLREPVKRRHIRFDDEGQVCDVEDVTLKHWPARDSFERSAETRARKRRMQKAATRKGRDDCDQDDGDAGAGDWDDDGADVEVYDAEDEEPAEDDIFPLPADMSTLPELDSSAVQPNDNIAFQRLRLVAGMPTMSPYIAARVVSVDDAHLTLMTARKHRAVFAEDGEAASLGRFQTLTDDRIGEATGFDAGVDENITGTDKSTKDEHGIEVTIAFAELGDPRLVLAASEVAPDEVAIASSETLAGDEMMERVGLEEPEMQASEERDGEQAASRETQDEPNGNDTARLSKTARRRRNQNQPSHEPAAGAGTGKSRVANGRRQTSRTEDQVDGVAAYLRFLRPQR